MLKKCIAAAHNITSMNIYLNLVYTLLSCTLCFYTFTTFFCAWLATCIERGIVGGKHPSSTCVFKQNYSAHVVLQYLLSSMMHQNFRLRIIFSNAFLASMTSFHNDLNQLVNLALHLFTEIIEWQVLHFLLKVGISAEMPSFFSLSTYTQSKSP